MTHSENFGEAVPTPHRLADHKSKVAREHSIKTKNIGSTDRINALNRRLHWRRKHPRHVAASQLLLCEIYGPERSQQGQKKKVPTRGSLWREVLWPEETFALLLWCTRQNLGKQT